MIKKYSLALILFICLFTVRAQKGALDLTFNPGSGVGGYTLSVVYAIALQPDKKIIIGGEFTTYNGDSVNMLVRLLPNGQRDTSFHVKANGWKVNSLVLQSDGKIVAGGGFVWLVDSVLTNNILRFNTDGSVDSTFYTGIGFNNEVRRLLIQPDGKILAGGQFTSYNNIPYGHVVRLNTDGTADTSFHASPGAASTVEAIVLQPDGKILIAGDFPNYDNDTLFRIARLNPDGSSDLDYNHLGGADKTVYGMALIGDTTAVIVGNLTTFNFQSFPGIAEIDSNGKLRPSIVFNPHAGANGEVDDVAIAGNNQILISGNFSAYGGTGFSGIASMDTSATPDTTFHSAAGNNLQIYKMDIQPNGKILIGGSFSSYNGTRRNGIARLYNCNTPQPSAIIGDTTFSCPGTKLIYSIAPVQGASNYIWSLPPGWTGNSDSTSIQVITSDTGGVISVIAFGDSCGNSPPQTLRANRIVTQGQPICLVTVDSQSLYNILIWEKPQTNTIDSFFIYRQDSTYVFTKIASVPYNAYSEYEDTASAANPNSTAHQYKISLLDTCGAESFLSDYHSTIFLQNLGNGNLSWAPYEIENAINPVIYYRVYRDTAGNGNFAPLNTIIPGGNTSYTDVDAALYPLADYVLDVYWSIACSLRHVRLILRVVI